MHELADSAGTDIYARYAYLGTVAVVKVEHPNVTGGLILTYGTAATDYPGLDRFGRVVDMKWTNTAATAFDRFGK